MILNCTCVSAQSESESDIFSLHPIGVDVILDDKMNQSTSNM